jgi:hypothetical protein
MIKGVLILVVLLALFVPTYVLAATPAVTTQDATNVAGATALLNGTIDSLGNSTVTRRGFQYGLTKTPTWDSYETGSFGLGDYSRAIAGLSTGTTYWFRAYAVNTDGTAYGFWASLRTIALPVTATSGSTYVGSSSVRLNGRLLYDGGEVCEYRFQYGYAPGVYSFQTDWYDSKTTGNAFYVDVTGLMASTDYFFIAQTRNNAGTSSGVERSFTTAWELLPPADFTAHATGGTEISLAWTRGGGAVNTLIVMQTGSYPTTIDEGTQAYFGPSSSVAVTGLTAGTTYYFSAWSESNGDYSAEYVTSLTTTLAGSTIVTPTEPKEPSGWFQIPSDARLVNMPFYPWINSGFDKYQLPHTTGWVLLALLLSVLFGLGIMAVFPRDASGSMQTGAIYAGLIAASFGIVVARWMGILPLWLILIPVGIGGGYAFVRNRT